MITMEAVDGKRAKINLNFVTSKFLMPDNLIGMETPDANSYLPHCLTINELGKQLLKAVTDGNVEEIRTLMGKGAPFTADWLGTSPLHLAAQNNHAEVCEILLRAGMSRDTRTKVDRTPLHMAAYEGHFEIVECLLKNGADYDCKDLLHMTPLHWAAQNGHAEVAATLIKFGAATNIRNKFDLTAAEIALQIDRPDIVDIINVEMRDPLMATQHLELEMMCDSTTDSAITPILNIMQEQNVILHENQNAVPIETIMLEEQLVDNTQQINLNHEEELEDNPQEEIQTIEGESINTFSESIKLLQEHGITMLPADENNILSSAMESGHSMVLTEAGKQALNAIKTTESNDISEYLKPKPPIVVPKRKKIITLTAEEFMTMTNNGTLTPASTSIIAQLNGKLMNNKIHQVKRIVSKKNKIVPVAHTFNNTNLTKVHKVENKVTTIDVQTLINELERTRNLVEVYKRKLSKAELEAANYKQQLRLLGKLPKS